MKPQSARISIFSNAKTERVYKASTGLSICEFNELALDIALYYDSILPQDVIEPYGTASSIEDAKELLFLVLYHHKTAVTYDVLGRVQFKTTRWGANQPKSDLRIGFSTQSGYMMNLA